MNSKIDRKRIVEALETMFGQFDYEFDANPNEAEIARGKQTFADRLAVWNERYQVAEKRDGAFISGRFPVKLTAKRLKLPVSPSLCALQDAANVKIDHEFRLPANLTAYLQGVILAAEEALFGDASGERWAYTVEDLQYAAQCFDYIAVCAAGVNTLERYYALLGMISLFTIAARKAEIGE